VNRYLTFTLDECYALNMDYIVEVIQYKPVTPVPETPSYIAGVINLRGTIVPVIDMRERFLKEPHRELSRRCILIIRFNDMLIGLLVDDNADIEELDPEKLTAPPQVGSNYSHVFIKSIGIKDDGMILIIDADKLIHLDELEVMDVPQIIEETEG